MADKKLTDEVLEDIKTAQGFDITNPMSVLKTARIALYIKLASKSVALVTGEQWDNLPEELGGVVTEMALAKFAKRGNEGKTEAIEEGLTDQWDVDDMSPYLTQLNAWNDTKANGTGSGNQGRAVSYD